MAEKNTIDVVPDTASSDSPSDGLPRRDIEGKHPHQVHAAMENGGAVRDANFMTRNGLNLESFKMRSYGLGMVELDRSMKHRHLQMIAIGGSIGAGFFVGSGSAFRNGGPGFVLIDFMIIGIMIFNVVYALGELAVMYPVSGGFYTYSVRFIDPSWGFAMGWNYVFQWLIVLPLELTVAGYVVQYWDKDLNLNLLIAIFWIFIIIINVFGALGFAEEEFWSSCLKLVTIITFMIIAVILVCGGGPSGGRYDEYWGARTWHDPGAFKNGFRGFCAVFVTAAFSFAGTELVGIAAAESANPAKALPSAIKQVFWRITLFFILGLFLVGLLVPSNDEKLLGSENAYKEGASMFVLAAKYAGLKGYDHFLNAVIMISVLSIGASCVYGGSRTLTALAQQGYAPKIFTYVDKSGRPLPSVLVHLAAGAFAYIQETSTGEEVFNWLLALSGLAALFTWGSICFAHIRFRQAWKHQGHTLDEIPFQAIFGVTGSWIGLILCVIVLIATLISAILPAGQTETATVEQFFSAWLTVPVILVFWIIGYVWKREGGLKLEQIDVDTGRREIDWDSINAYRAEVASWPKWKQIMSKIY
ncbi:Amino-acid permease inda1 [Cadophora gregata]|uniref:Amino-acid permease inda1 n=1 Tax=Cadophora gregata TaxID=51156 RepID=UPI0026DACC27|nr:Amino-acid permease inda1 [Cadophora gregata]KAK0108520.1 Amino-acid permease inda1 [Cadophora gregata]KAK0108884.1 Amino-acid permease inda1 [Cadophora gregata f. sp. sojae]